jgi:hypothetical protein
MGKNQFPSFAKLAVGAVVQNSKTSASTKFIGTENPRYLRVIHSRGLSARSREGLDRITDASNGQPLITNLRECGLTVPCRLTPGIDVSVKRYWA